MFGHYLFIFPQINVSMRERKSIYALTYVNVNPF